MTEIDPATIARTAQAMRRDIIEMVGGAGSGHPGGSLSAVEIVATLYGGILHHDPADPGMLERDRFVLSKGHAAPVLYAALAEHGYFPVEELKTLRKLGSRLQGHPDMRKTPGVEASTGSLGQGLAIANGIALALHLQRGAEAPLVYCLLGDGELQEGEVWEAAMFAAHNRLSNIVAIVDNNGLQIDGATSEVMDLGSIEDKFSAFGWQVMTCDGHSVAELVDALTKAKAAEGPVCIVAKTMKGRGVSFMEGLCDWHGKAPDAEQCEQALSEISAAGGWA